MGSLYRQRHSRMWWMKLYINGRPVRESTGTADRKEAERILKQREGRIAEGHVMLPRLDLILYDEIARDLRLHYQATGTRNCKEAEYRLVHLDPFFGRKRVARITPAEVTAYIAHRQKEGAAPKSINNELEVLIKMLRLAYENGKLMRLPVIHKLKVNNVRKGFFEEEAYNKVRRLLPSDYQAVLAIAYTYGWRTQSEVLMLEWRMVDFSAGLLRLDPGMTKNDDGRVVYLTPEVKQLLTEQRERVKELERQMGKVIPWVFPHLRGSHRGARLQDFKKAWKTACQRAGYPGMLRHDFRRTAVRNLVNAGVREKVAMEITGHRSRSVFDRYHIVSPSDHQEAIRKLTGIVSGIVEDHPTMP